MHARQNKFKKRRLLIIHQYAATPRLIFIKLKRLCGIGDSGSCVSVNLSSTLLGPNIMEGGRLTAEPRALVPAGTALGRVGGGVGSGAPSHQEVRGIIPETFWKSHILIHI
jgi:hypothetical protein